MTNDGWSRAALSVIAAIAIFAALHLASSVFAPLACALFIMAIVAPMQSLLQARLPTLVALAIVILTIVVVFVIFASLVAWSFGRVAQGLVADTGRLQALYEQATAWLEAHGVGVAALWAEHFNVRWLVRAVQEIAERLNATIGFWLVVLVYVILGLLEVDGARRRIGAMANREAARVLIEGSVASAAKFRSYLLIRTQMSLATGLLVWVLASVTGLQLAAEWGVIAFALNYVPFIGPFIATVFPCRRAARPGRRREAPRAASHQASRATTTMGWITRRTSQPARPIAADADSTRKGMSSVTISTTAPPRTPARASSSSVGRMRMSSWPATRRTAMR